MAVKSDTVRLNRVLPRVEAAATAGLTHEQARERFDNGYANIGPDSAGKTVGQVIKGHVFTYFNLVFLLLGLCTLFWGSIGNIFFINVVIINTVIGIIQELRSRAALSKLTFMSMPQATAIRNGEQISIPAEATVLDDVVVFSSGQQIYADAIVLEGECQVNEALVTGEADEITKNKGDALLSGSFIVSGECIARLDKVGEDSFVAKLTIDAKKSRNKLSSGSMVSALKRLVQVIGIVIVPLGITMFILQAHGYEVQNAVDSTVAALVGMIPDGLYLLVSITLTVSVLRLARKRTLVQEMGCVETLARVDVLCVDKTGTITENAMEVKEIALLCEERYNADDIDRIIADYVGNMPSENETMAAIQSYMNTPATRGAVKTMPFSSAVKYGGVSFSSSESYLLGAPERILQTQYYKYQSIIEAHSARGYRVLLLALYDKNINEKLDASRLMPLALILISNRVRAEAPSTFEFFAKQGVKIIVISGDNPMTVSQIAREAGIEGAERYIDAVELTTERKIRRAVEDYVIFGRVTPDQKRKLVRALKKAGHTVAMTGDGVNDVLALKDANCSIAMASGSEVASQVADIVLLDSDFSAMPAVVMEGRRVINNLQRSASLFIMKNIFSFLFACTITIPFLSLFPMEGLQFTLYNTMIIGIPSFILAMEPNYSIVSGRFLINVFRSALPAGLASFAALTAIFLLYRNIDIPIVEMQTMSVISITFVGFLMLLRLCNPFNKLRIALLIGMLIAFIGGFLLFSGTINILPEEFVKLTLLSGSNILWLLGVCAAATPIFLLLTYITRVRKA
ncbi:MAG: HAD-IC family P-type ATPase [Oscillospiraceae bacterium]|nr:HAD-IC family P-type ATPase [Oscillospiraceae bacterium]